MAAEMFSAAGVAFRRAVRADVVGIVALLADDPLGVHRESLVHRESPDVAPYLAAFDMVDADPGQLLLVGELAGDIVATYQLSFIPGLARGGALRAQIEAVRVAESLRGTGVGSAMVHWAIDEARRRGCALVQLTTDKSRVAAHRFYERLGFTASHEGMKLGL